MTIQYKIRSFRSKDVEDLNQRPVTAELVTYPNVVWGAGPSAKSAGEDAMEVFWVASGRDITVESAEHLEQEISNLPPHEDAHDGCAHDFLGEDPLASAVACKAGYLVLIAWREMP